MCLCVSDKVIEVRTNRMNDYYIMKGICDDMNKKIKTPEVEQLFKGMLCLKSVEECYEFFEDICTINELLSLSQRFEVARMLLREEDIP